ncbi:hypothetical protein PPYR_08371 [Photinus pyralis]|uniref:Putative alpha-L-fucosidase n=4 Tax=Photinus pyralis TaxID=7054 RepID=A0A1Y1KFM4_PHOPY|nr:alpha-L-fucosidase-like [Photinus pyralis]KAB0797377.1 hypothetical protein PPYR_08371 [Photinus pyralis]
MCNLSGRYIHKMVRVVFSVIAIFAFTYCDGQVRYDPTWESLDKRPLPQWFDEAKFGIFLHWGVYSVPSFGSEWFWSNWKSGNKDIVSFMKKNYPPNFTYQDFAKDFSAQLFDPNAWAKLFVRAGAKYVVLTSKHHEGYTLWPSKYSFSWNVRDVGPNRNLLGELAAAVRTTNVRFGVYHSLYEWYNPLYLSDKGSNFTKNNFVSQKVIPEMMELVQDYTPDVIWSDGDWEANDTYWKSTEFLAWLYNESPVKDTVVVNDRWGKGIPCRHGDFYNCKDRYDPGVLQKHKWENAMTVDKGSWGYRRNVNYDSFYTVKELIQVLAETVSCGGNLLVNVGPTSDGRIDPIFEDRLINLGRWLSINGRAIYATKPWQYQKDSLAPVWYTSSKSVIYAIVLDWPPSNTLSLASSISAFKINATKVSLLGNPENLHWEFVNNTVSIKFPDKATVKCDWSWTLQIQNDSTNEVNDNYY